MDNIFLLITISIIGLCIGSFLNVLIYRIPRGYSGILLGRSKCCECNNILGWKDLIPVISFLVLKGRCRHCGSKISNRYMIVEVITSAITLLIIISIGVSIEGILILLAMYVLIVSSYIDMDFGIVPNKLSIVLLLIAVIFILSTGEYVNLIESFIFFIVLFLIWYVSSGGIGGGDIKLFIGISMIFGIINSFIILGISCILASALIIKFKIRNENLRNRKIKFVPFITTATICLILFENHITTFLFGI